MKISKPLLGLVLFSALAFLFLFMAGFFTSKLPEQPVLSESNKDRIEGIETTTLMTQQVLSQREFTGTVVANQKSLLAARLTATIAEVLVDVGAQVKQGDILIRLESSDLDARVNQTEQALSSAQSQLNVARKQYKRAETLLAKKLISQSDFDQIESQLKTANADFKQAKATVKEAETTYGFSIITAPFDGVVDTRAINEGDTATPGMHLLSLYNPDTLQLEVNISESLLSNTTIGTLLDYQIPSFDIQAQGNVIEVSPATDSSSRSFLLKIALAQHNEKLFPGSYARIWVDSEMVEQLVVPNQAVYQVGQLDYVKVIEEGKVETKLIQLADNFHVRKGLKNGDVVILDPLNQGLN